MCSRIAGNPPAEAVLHATTSALMSSSRSFCAACTEYFRNGLSALGAVRQPRGVPEVDERFARQLRPQRLEHRKPADTGVEHADRRVVHSTSGRMCGNRITSRIDGESVRNIARRSIPTPSPAVGGMPYSNART